MEGRERGQGERAGREGRERGQGERAGREGRERGQGERAGREGRERGKEEERRGKMVVAEEDGLYSGREGWKNDKETGCEREGDEKERKMGQQPLMSFLLYCEYVIRIEMCFGES